MPSNNQRAFYQDKVNTIESTIEELIEVNLDPNDPKKKVLVGALLIKKKREELVEFLKKSKYIFS